MPGLLQHLDVASDTEDQLRHALALTLPWHRKGASHYKITSEKGFDAIELQWGKECEQSLPLPYPLDTLDKMFSFVRDWLSSAERGMEYDTDGSVSKGWRVTQGSFYALCRVQADWIIYGK